MTEGSRKSRLAGKTINPLCATPHAEFINMLANKCGLVGIEMILTEESCPSKCSFLDLEPIQKQDVDAGRREKSADCLSHPAA